MTKQIHFVVYYDPSDDKFWLDDETLMTKFGDRAWWDNEADEWVRPEDEVEEALDRLANDRLAVFTQPTGTTAYFATDGSFGVAEGIELVDTSDWVAEDWVMIEMTPDDQRPKVARAITERKKREAY
jgi:hypothetical protein